MKKITILFVFVLFSVSAFSKKTWVPFTSEQPAAYSVSILASDRSGLLLEVNIPGMFSETVNREGMTFQRIMLDENRTTKEVGRPELPMIHELIGFPGNERAAITILEMETMKFSGYNIYPFQTPTTDNAGAPVHDFVKDEQFYRKDARFPAENVIAGQPGIWRDVKVAGIHFTPFTYNPVSQELEIITKLQIRIEFKGVDDSMDFMPNKELTPKFYRMYEAAIANFEDLGYTMTLRDTPGIKYLVITNDEALSAIQPLVDWKNQMGHLVEVRLIEPGFNTPQHFKDYISGLYDSDGLEYVLMVGDAYPYGGSSGGPNIVPMYWWQPSGETGSYSDSWYTCLDGPDDHFADLAIGRFAYDVNQLGQLETQIQKTMTHYHTPDVSDNWAENTILIAHKEQYPGKYTQCCEEIRQYPYSIQVPEFETAYGGENYSNGQVVEFVNNSGVGIFNYRGHGSSTQLWDWTTANPNHFTATNVNQLTNYDQLFVFFDVCCDNMNIITHPGDCLCESFMKHEGGSVAVNGAIIPSYTIPNHDYDKEMYKAVFDEGITNIGYVTNFANLTVLNAHGDIGRSNVRTYLWLGDASVEAWTLQPTTITALHDDQLFLGLSEFVVSVMDGGDPVEHAMVCVANDDGSVYGVAYTDAAGVATVQFDGPVEIPGDAKVTVTRNNYIPYQAVIPVIPQAGPYVIKDSWVINDIAGGNGNGLMDYAESILLSLSVKNVGIQQAQNVTVSLTTEDEYINITTGSANFGNIDPEAIVTVEDAFAFDVAEDIPDNHAVLFTVSASDGTDTWNSNIVITGHAPVLVYDSYEILDPGGNSNGKLDPGEEATVVVTVKNSGAADAYDVFGELITSDPYLNVTQTTPQSIGDLASDATATVSFDVQADEMTPAGHTASLDIEMTAEHNIAGTGSFNIIIGQIPVVIIDLDPNNSSGPEMQTAMNTMGVSSEYTTTFPDNMTLFSSAFVCLGIYNSNHQLSSAQGQVLADFLNNGGALYMEGGDTWHYDQPTPVHPMFNIDPVGDGSSDLSTINGQAGTFTEGMSFVYNGENSWIDRIDAITPAVKILQNQSPSYGTAVAYDEGSYKTIGASHEFGGLTDGASTKAELMEQYLIFFNIISTGVTANFQADMTELCEGEEVQFTDFSSGNVTEWAWEFPGGTPATSNEQSPTVIYNSGGQFDVTLEVTGPAGSHSTTKSNYISVMEMPGTAATPVGITTLCQNSPLTSYTTTGAANATEYLWTITPDEAGIITGNGLESLVAWSDDFYGESEITVMGVNDCGEGSTSLPVTVTVEPMPEAAGEITGPASVCQSFTDIYLVDEIGHTITYNWILEPAEAGTMLIEDNEVTITWSETYEGLAVLKVCGENECGEGELSEDFEIAVENCTGIDDLTFTGSVSVYPNPNTGAFTINLETHDQVTIKLINTVGEVVYQSEQISISGQHAETLKLNNLTNGVYYLRIEGTRTNLIEKLVISK
jgi:PKD repeat protein